jgi:hypothetical protein
MHQMLEASVRDGSRLRGSDNGDFSGCRHRSGVIIDGVFFDRALPLSPSVVLCIGTVSGRR